MLTVCHLVLMIFFFLTFLSALQIFVFFLVPHLPLSYVVHTVNIGNILFPREESLLIKVVSMMRFM